MSKQDSGPGLGEYDTFADVVGGVPNLRGQDNAMQAICGAVGLVLGAGAGVVVVLAAVKDGVWWVGAAVGGVAGLIAGVFISGLVLMIKGWLRVAKK